MPFNLVQAFWYWDEVTGEFQHRIGLPGKALAQDSEFTVNNLHIYHPLFHRFAMEADLLVLHMVYQPEILRLIQLRKAAGRPTVFEIADNFLGLGAWIPANDPHRNPYLRQNLLYYASICDGLQVSSDSLFKLFEPLNSNRITLRNQVPTPAELPVKPPGFVIGWGGSQGHGEDIALIVPALCEFCRRHPDASFQYMGFKPYFDYFKEIPESQKKYHQAAPLESYYQFLAGIHVGLAPLLDTAFNRSRSDVKYLEYAANGAVALLSDMPNYQEHGLSGERALLFRSPEELLQQLEWLYADRGRLARMADAGRRYVREERHLGTHLEHRRPFYRKLLPPKSVQPSFGEIPSSYFLIRTVRDIQSAFNLNEIERGLGLSKELIKAFPEYHLGHFWMMKTLLAFQQPQLVIDFYGDYEAPEIYRDLVYENLYLAAEQLKQSELAASYLLRIEDPVRRLHLRPTSRMDKENYLRQVLALKPFDWHAITGMLEILLSRPQGQETEILRLTRIAKWIQPENTAWSRIESNLHGFLKANPDGGALTFPQVEQNEGL